MTTAPKCKQGDRHDPALSNADIAAILRSELKTQFPEFAFSVTKRITVTVTGRGLRGSTDELTPLGQQTANEVRTFCNRWNFCHAVYGDSQFSLSVRVEERLSRSDIAAEMERLKQEFWISDWATLKETMFSVDEQSPLIREAFHRLYAALKPKKPRPELKHAVTAEFMKWVEKVKTWVDDSGIQYDRGPKFWKVMVGERVLCFVDGIDGTIYKASYGPQTDSPRGTIFDDINVFNNGRLLTKRQFDWMAYYSQTVGKTFPSINEAWAYVKARRKLRDLLEREPTPEEIELVAVNGWSIVPGTGSGQAPN